MDSSVPRPDSSPQATGTFFDTFDGWAQLLRQARPEQQTPAGDQTGEGDCAAEVAPGSFPPADWATDSHAGPEEALPWRPLHRPPMALVHIVDDGRDTGEIVRLRDDTLLIGRSTGGVVIRHDPSLCEQHARLDRLPGGGWLLTDLGTTAGTWVRVTTARLRPGTRFQLGGTRIEFAERASGTPLLVASATADHWEYSCPSPPFLIGRAEAAAAGDGEEAEDFRLEEGMRVVGIDDPFISPIHAEVIAGRRGWRIVNRGLNGLWVRLATPLRLDATAQFQCGEQRFVLELLEAPLAS